MTEQGGGLRLTPRQARSRRTIIAIEQAARHVLATVGRDRFTTADIAHQAGVSIGTFYRYFPDRVDVLNHVWPNRSDTFLT